MLKIIRLRFIFIVIDLNAFLYYSRAIHLSSNRKEWPMYRGKTIFAQIIDYLPMYDFHVGGKVTTCPSIFMRYDVMLLPVIISNMFMCHVTLLHISRTNIYTALDFFILHF